MTFSQGPASVFPRLGLRDAPFLGTQGPVCGSAAWGWVLDLHLKCLLGVGTCQVGSWSSKSRRSRFQMGRREVSETLRDYSQSCKKTSVGRENKGKSCWAQDAPVKRN